MKKNVYPRLYGFNTTQTGIRCTHYVVTCFSPGMFIIDSLTHRCVSTLDLLFFFFKKYALIVHICEVWRLNPEPRVL